MNKIQKEVIRILRYSLKKEKINKISLNKNQWNRMYEEVKCHQIISLIYDNLSDVQLKSVDVNLYEEWRKKALSSSVTQIKQLRDSLQVFKALKDEKINFICLKGLAIRELYAKPELRAMGDYDILVHSRDIEKTEKILIKLGYTKYKNENDHHLSFVHPSKYMIEVHWILVNSNIYSGENSFTSSIWENAQPLLLGGEEFKALSWEDMVIHLCVHMAMHFVENGFGIRPLYDLTLLVNEKHNFINWKSIVIKAKECNVESFISGIFSVCNKLFDLQIPREILELNSLDNKEIDIFIDCIFASGLRGNRDFSERIINRIEAGSKKRVFKGMMSCYFPPYSFMKQKFSYVERFKPLILLAWLQRLLLRLISSEDDIKTKISFLFNANKKINNKKILYEKFQL